MTGVVVGTLFKDRVFGVLIRLLLVKELLGHFQKYFVVLGVIFGIILLFKDILFSNHCGVIVGSFV